MTAFDKIAAGLNDAIAYLDGDTSRGVAHVREVVDVKPIRAKTGMTQAQFAAAFGFDVAAVRDWEQRRRQPERTARALLTMIDREPATVRRLLQG